MLLTIKFLIQPPQNIQLRIVGMILGFPAVCRTQVTVHKPNAPITVPFDDVMDGKKDSTGLGLAIARSIALSSSLKLTYEWQNGMHTFRLVKESKIYR